MIFRAPAGHILLSQKQIEILKAHIEYGNTQTVKELIEACNESILIDSLIRQKWELKKMMEEDGEDTEDLEDEIISLSKKRKELSTIFERNALQ